MLNYLYYKLYKASLKSSLNDIPEFFAAVSFGSLIGNNLIVLNMLLSKLDLLPFLLRNKYLGGLFVIVIMMITFYYFKGIQLKKVLDKYANETEKNRIKGNILIAIYVAISFLSIFAVAFFRPGKL